MSAPSPVSLLDCAILVGDEISRLETWERLAKLEGQPFDAGKARQLAVWRKLVSMLDGMLSFPDEFAAFAAAVKLRRENAAAQTRRSAHGRSDASQSRDPAEA